MENSPIISVKNISKIYNIYDKPEDRLKQATIAKINGKKYFREFVALKDINFEIFKGESIGLIGRNGAGKSTLLQIIAGTLTPTTGAVFLEGRVNALLELGSGFNPEFTGIENVYLNGTILGLTKTEIDNKLEQILSFADIGDFVYQPVKTYSSGMSVRLAFAVQVFLDPDILIVDEALSVGDVFFQRKCHKVIQQILDKGTSLIFVTHDTHTVVQYCQKTVFLKEGKQIYFGNSTMATNLYNKSDRMSTDELLKEISFNKSEIEKKKLPSNLKLGMSVPDQKKIEVGDFRTIDFIGYSFGTSSINSQENFLIHDKLRIVIRLKNLGNVESIIPGLSINSLKNVSVYGMYGFQFPEVEPNSFLCEKNDELEFKFEIDLGIIPGDYLVLVTCISMKKEDILDIHKMKYALFSEKQQLHFVIGIGKIKILMPTDGTFIPFNGIVYHSTNLSIKKNSESK
ncbi:MAG: ABC transporter ATP-binding protein [Leptospiraceae bacterium]|nr:ABC transporter ATP-binding protein [Leptospiraceae bacterium]